MISPLAIIEQPETLRRLPRSAVTGYSYGTNRYAAEFEIISFMYAFARSCDGGMYHA